MPENHKKKRSQVEGTLEIQDNGVTSLDLSGALISDNKQPYLFFEKQEITNIWGIAENGQELSLLDCIRIRATQHLGENGKSLEIYKVRFLLKNAWVKNIHSQYFNKISASIEGLDQWVNISGGKEKRTFPENEPEIFSYTYQLPDPINFKTEDELKGCFYFMLKKNNEGFHYQLQQFTCLELNSEKPQSLSFLLEKLNHFIRFLNIVSDSILGIEFITMTSFKNVVIIQNQKKYYEELNLISVKGNYPFKNINKNQHDFRVKYEKIKDNFGEVMKNWFGLKSDPMRRIIDILYECIENKSKIRINLFLAVSQAAEGFYRVDKNQKNQYFDKMIRTMLSENIDKIRFQYSENIDKNIDNLTKSIKELRNNLTHIGKFKNQEIKTQEIYVYTNLLRNIISIAILKKIGIDEDEISIVQ